VALFKRFGQAGEQGGHFAGDLCAAAGGVKGVGCGPDGVQPCPHLGLSQLGQGDAVAARVGEGGVGATTAAELGIHLDDGAHIDHQHKRRAAFRGGQCTGVGLGLAAGAQQAVVKTFGVAGGFEFFGLQHKVAAFVAVHPPGASSAVAVLKGDGPLEHVALLGRGVRVWLPQQVAQVVGEALCGRQFAGLHALPFGQEGDGCGVGFGRAEGSGGVVCGSHGWE
jgi:hypothetical protein